MATPKRVVFDSGVLFQALISESGPAARLLENVIAGRVSLYTSPYVFEELRAVTSRPKIKERFNLETARVEAFIERVQVCSTHVTDVAHVFDFPRDPDDAHYIDLAVAAGAHLVVARDNDLLSLRDESTESGRDFVKKYPDLLIETPPEALKILGLTAQALDEEKTPEEKDEDSQK